MCHFAEHLEHGSTFVAGAVYMSICTVHIYCVYVLCICHFAEHLEHGVTFIAGTVYVSICIVYLYCVYVILPSISSMALHSSRGL